MQTPDEIHGKRTGPLLKSEPAPSCDLPSGPAKSLNLLNAIAAGKLELLAATITTTPSPSMSSGSALSATVALTPDELRLIAAAPDMLAALKDARANLWDSWHPFMSQADFEADRTISAINAAISKATMTAQPENQSGGLS